MPLDENDAELLRNICIGRAEVYAQFYALGYAAAMPKLKDAPSLQGEPKAVLSQAAHASAAYAAELLTNTLDKLQSQAAAQAVQQPVQRESGIWTPD